MCLEPFKAVILREQSLKLDLALPGYLSIP